MGNRNEKMLLIQVLRGFAAIIVLLHHGVSIMANDKLHIPNTVLSAGWVGVDLFFVLSGFIIFYTSRELFGKKQKLKSFLLKRFVRIYPIYWIVTIGALILFTVTGTGGASRFEIGYVIKSFLIFPQPNDPIINVGWSLEYEIFFYCMFGVLIFFKSKTAKTLLAIWGAGILLNSFGFLNLDGLFLIDFIFSNNHIEFLIGCLAAYLVLKYDAKNKLLLFLMGFGLFIVGWINVVLGNIDRHSLESMLMFGVSCGLIVFSCASLDLHKKPKVPKFFLLLGDASYSIYLTHVLVFAMLNKIFVKLDFIHPLISLLAISIITVWIGVLFYKVAEKPVLNLSRNIVLYKKDQVYKRRSA